MTRKIKETYEEFDENGALKSRTVTETTEENSTDAAPLWSINPSNWWYRTSAPQYWDSSNLYKIIRGTMANSDSNG